MALYRCEVKNISRGKGRSVVAASAYRSGERLVDERQQMTHDYTRREDVAHSEIIAPEGAPAWASDRAALWNHADAAEKRKDARTAKEVLVALPRELTPEQQREAVREFVRDQFTSRGLVADVAIHVPQARDGGEQPHAHILTTTRPLDGDGFAKGKDRTLDQPQGIEALREAWGETVNRSLERAGRLERVDHRRLDVQAKDREAVSRDKSQPLEVREQAAADAFVLTRDPEPKIGPTALRMERQGRGDKAHALRDALGVRKVRHGLERMAREWRKLRGAARDLAGRVAEKGRDALDHMTPGLRKGLETLAEAGRILAREDALARQLAEVGKMLKAQDQARQAMERQRHQARARSWRPGPTFGPGLGR